MLSRAMRALAALTLCAGVFSSHATASDFDLFAGGATPEKFLYFTGFDLWRYGGSVHGGLRWSPHGVDHDGFTIKALIAEGAYRYTSGTRDIRGINFTGSVMPGWQFVRGKFIATLLAGLDVQHHRFLPDDPANPAHGTHLGARVNADLWWEPNATMMSAASLSASSIGNSYWARAAIGWRMMEKFWIGPEAIALGDRTFHQYSAGLHLTALKANHFEWSFASGYTRDQNGRAGLYGRMGMLARR